ncbi:XrtA/PEP-CTERM system TPR-repeat protein PrsT [Massilia sp. CCM 8734]|uniref:XrtA/PEP-CTERM system TPR-repeat protein PrsT n=1 Tax=Massilia sp. CCM 8734 TaxID=2609283 RepID=UPI0014234A79|nr:XrtA/PEP-CTERM system TPR-repeat protein PrsT [Massilia sp. CCM 8734]NHZ97180.1 PEP-CTERM system TPR-repeat protein PrsT [Massilia sp. CCM 8734]
MSVTRSVTRSKAHAGAAVVSALLLLGAVSACGKTETSASLVADARQFIAKGDSKAAVIQLKNALVKNPSDADARLTLGLVYLDIGDAVSAEKELRKAIELGAPKDKAVPALAKVLMMQQQYQKVLDETGSATADADMLALRAEASAGLGHADQAKDLYAQALAAKPGHVGALIGAARQALARKDLEEANRLADQVVASNPSDATAWMFKGDLLRAQAKGKEALAAYDQVIKLKPEHRSAHLERAFVEIAEGKFDAAKADLEAARKISPNALMVSYAQALLDFTQGKHAAAKETLQKVLRVAPEHMPSVLMAGAVEHALGSMPQAEQHLRKYLAAMPEHRYARKLMVSTLLKMGQTTEALAQLTPMLESGKDDVQLLALAGEAYMQARDYAKATAYFEQASALAPDAAGLRTSLALGKLATGDDARAISELEQSTKLDAKSPKAAVLLVMTELRLKRYDKALAAAKALEATQPLDPMVHNLKGGVYLGMNDMVNARASFDKALALKPDYFPAAANLAQLALREKKPDLAKQQLVNFLTKDKKNVEAYYALTKLALAQGRNDEANQWLEKASSENPDAIGPARTLGAHYLSIGQKDKALNLARKFQVANPKNLDLLDLLGQAQLANGDVPGALDTYGKLAGVAPKSAMAHFRLATVHAQMKNLNATAEDLKKALSLQADFVDAQVAQAELAANAGKLDDALAIARQIQKQRPKEALGFQLEGNLSLAQGKPAQAVASFDKAFALTPSSANLIKLHAAMRQSGKGKEADARLAKAASEHPNDVALALYVAENDLAGKRYKAAIGGLEAVLKQAPENAAALNNLAWAYQQEKDPRALKTAEKAFALAGNSAAVTDTLGWMLVEQGDAKRGLSLLQKAVALAPDAADIRFHLAAGLAKTGDKAGAKRELEKVMASKNFAQMEEAKALAKEL